MAVELLLRPRIHSGKTFPLQRDDVLVIRQTKVPHDYGLLELFEIKLAHVRFSLGRFRKLFACSLDRLARKRAPCGYGGGR
jgi:hypothetical protein